jgi:putative hydrolase of the HAD superfamily
LRFSSTNTESALSGGKIIAWDFDGVLNRNIENGQFLWAKNFEADLGQSQSLFNQHIFDASFDAVMTGREDLRDRVDSWSKTVGYSGGPDALLAYWFTNDSFPDPSMLEIIEILSKHGIRQVIATNNESRRTRFIETEMGYAALVEHVFSSGRMGFRKPEPKFFETVTNSLGVEPQDMLLIDDTRANTEQAALLGWRSIHFTDNIRSSFRRQLFELLELS